MTKKGILETIIAGAFIFSIGFMFSRVTENYSIKHTDIKIIVGNKYIYSRTIDRDRNPFTKKLQDTLLITEIKDGYVLYSMLKNDTVEFNSSTRLSWLQEDIIDSLKTK